MTALQFAELRNLLVFIAGTLVDIREGLIAEVAESTGCTHPETRRVSLSTPDDPDHWVCLECKLDNKHAVMN